MGYGSGVLRAYYACYLLRGLTVGVAGTASLFIARKTGLPQNMLVAARGLGLTIGPSILSPAISRLMWTGNSEVAVAAALFVKMLCEAAVARVETPALLYLAFLGIGLAMALLDTFATTLVSHIHKERCGTVLVGYDLLYGTGCMLAPFIAVAIPGRAWDFLVVADFVVFATLTSKRLRRGKPRDWKVKIRGLAVAADVGSAPGGGTDGTCANKISGPISRAPPARVVRTGLAFTFAVQATMTAVSCWGFTYAATIMRLPLGTAAWVPTTFYAACTATRLVVVPVSARVAPSTILHIGTVMALSAALMFCFIDKVAATLYVNATASSQLNTTLHAAPLLACFALMGAGFSPHFSLMISAMQRHGELDSRLHGLYGTSTSLGITMGMWLPGYFSLPYFELFGCIGLFLILNANSRDFPRRSSPTAQTIVVAANVECGDEGGGAVR
eukprot:TRINITY_DN21564_c0_g1_i2.p1 TRINITY_DN21564_c0_g1~~TRINITY_DN21564_c0_g1_i2.p1  ORF type:complete len:444 (-),score=34.73 TRINITY_DN21564_c0_g1_i2:338-1669(-)